MRACIEIKDMTMIIKYYETVDGKLPFLDWFESIKSKNLKMKIFAKLEFLELGYFANAKPLGSEVFELRPYGVRVYFLKYKNAVILLLLGGEKDKQQQRDIEKAKKYAKDFFEREKKNEKQNIKKNKKF
jgi:putative addiction module killer protein